MIKLFDKTIDYITEHTPNFKINNRGNIRYFTCPVCQNDPITCHFIPNTNNVKCEKCQTTYGNIVELVRVLEEDKIEFTDDEIVKYLAEKYGLEIITNTDVQLLLDYYHSNGFDLVPIVRNGKAPIEKEWTIKTHKDIEEWNKWLDIGNNIGIKTGKCSGITVLDLDTKEALPEELKELANYSGFLQETTKGYHYFFQYEELPKTRLNDFKLDIENDKGQVVACPSLVDGKSRKILSKTNIPKMPTSLLEYLKKRTAGLKSGITLDEEIKQDIAKEKVSFDELEVTEGNRNNFLIKVGGIMRKRLGMDETNYVMQFVNNSFVNPPLTRTEFATVWRNVEKYVSVDNKEVIGKVLDYMKIVGEATCNMTEKAIEEKKMIVTKSLEHLIKEGYVIKGSRGIYKLIKKAEWKDTFPSLDNQIDFKMPFFDSEAIFNWGDMLLLGSKTKWGKTTICMNILKSLSKQGIKPYYISLETGSRFIKTAQRLGLVEGDFYWDFQADPTKIELEKNAVTILDWLLVENKAETDLVLKHFVEQLYKTNGVLIIFMQLKEHNSDWFAPNMVKQFPALASRYLYDDDSDGTRGRWVLDSIRESKFSSNRKTSSIPCEYDWETRELKVIE